MLQWILANCMLGYCIFSITACVRQLPAAEQRFQPVYDIELHTTELHEELILNHIEPSYKGLL